MTEGNSPKCQYSRHDDHLEVELLTESVLVPQEGPHIVARIPHERLPLCLPSYPKHLYTPKYSQVHDQEEDGSILVISRYT
jgi:hypothetical protein